MQSDVGAKVERLRAAGLIGPGELPQEYETVVDSFTPDELEVLISVRKRLLEASRVSGIAESEVFFAP